MATNALRNQVAAKWQEAFTRLNRGEPGISGLLTFSQAWSLSTDFLRPKNINDPTSIKEYNRYEQCPAGTRYYQSVPEVTYDARDIS